MKCVLKLFLIFLKYLEIKNAQHGCNGTFKVKAIIKGKATTKKFLLYQSNLLNL